MRPAIPSTDSPPAPIQDVELAEYVNALRPSSSNWWRHWKALAPACVATSGTWRSRPWPPVSTTSIGATHERLGRDTQVASLGHCCRRHLWLGRNDCNVDRPMIDSKTKRITMPVSNDIDLIRNRLQADTGIKMTYSQVFNFLVHFYIARANEPKSKWKSLS